MAPGQVLERANALPQQVSVLMIISGEAEVEGSVGLRTLTEGAMLGWCEAVLGKPSASTVTCKTPLTAWAFPAAKLKQLASDEAFKQEMSALVADLMRAELSGMQSSMEVRGKLDPLTSTRAQPMSPSYFPFETSLKKYLSVAHSLYLLPHLDRDIYCYQTFLSLLSSPLAWSTPPLAGLSSEGQSPEPLPGLWRAQERHPGDFPVRRRPAQGCAQGLEGSGKVGAGGERDMSQYLIIYMK